MKKKILSLLVLLAAAVSGAWAKVPTFEKTIFETTETLSTPIYVTENTEITISSDAVVTINGGLIIEDNATLTVKGPGKLVVNGTNGSEGSPGSGYTGATGGQGTDGSAAITGNIVVKGATVQATGGAGGAGGRGGIGSYSPSGPGGKGGKGGKGAAAFTGAVTIFSGTIIAKGGKGGDGGEGGDGDQNQMNPGNPQPDGDQGEGGDSGNPFAGTLTFYGGTVNAKGVSPGYGKPNGNIAKAFANNVTMKTTTYELRGSNTGNNSAIELAEIKNYTWVDIIAADYVEPTFDYVFTVIPTDHGSGTVKFFIGDEEVQGAMQADAGKEVTMTVTPDEGWTVDNANVTVATPYTDWESAGARRMISGPTKVDILNTVPLTYVSTDAQGVATFTFNMPASSVRVKGAYKKVSTLYFDPAGKTNLMEIKVGDDKVNVKDSKTVKIEKVERVLEGTPVNLKATPGYKFRKVSVKKGKPEAPEYADKLTEISGDNALNGVASINETITRDQALALAQYLASQTGTDCLVMYGAKPTSPNPSATVSAVDNNGNNRSVYYKKAISSSEQTGLSAYGNKVYYVAQ